MGLRDAWMNFWGFSEDNQEMPKEEEKPKNVQIGFVTDSELGSYEESRVGKLDIMLTDLFALKEILPAQATKLITRINNFQSQLEDSTQDPLELTGEFVNIQTEFESLRKMADATYKINELKKQNDNMKKRFRKPVLGNSGERELENAINEYTDYIERIQKSVDEEEQNGNPIFSEFQREVFNRESLRAEYRLGMLMLLRQVVGDWHGRKKISINPFGNLPETKRKMFTSFLLEDAKELGDDFDLLTNSSDLIKRYYSNSSMDELDQYATELDNLIADALVTGELSAHEIFDSESKDFDSLEFLRKMLLLRYHTNQITGSLKEFVNKNIERIKRDEAEKERAEEIKKEREEEAKRKAEEAEKARLDEEKKANRYKSITDEEVEAEIQEIESDLVSTGNRYVNILDFQKMVAREKGLLTTESRVQTKGLAYFPVTASKLYAMIKLANETGIVYTVFPGSQEFDKDADYLFVVSESDKSKVEVVDKKPFNSSIGTPYDTISLGKYSTAVMWMIHKKLLGKIEDKGIDYRNFADEIRYIDTKAPTSELRYEVSYADMHTPIEFEKKSVIISTIKEVLHALHNSSLDSTQMLKDIKCYLSVPAQRNILPILAELQKAGIDFYMEPEPTQKSNRNLLGRGSIHIYFDRKNLEKYRSTVESKLNTLGAPVTLGGVTIDFADEMVDECEWDDSGKIIRE